MSTPLAVRRVLELHDRARHPDAIGDSLGDAALCSGSPVYQNVRREALRCGYAFRPHHQLFGDAYVVSPLFCLELVLDRKVVPYCDNVSVLRFLSEQTPGLCVPLAFLLDNLKANVSLHEGAHAIAHERLFAGERLRSIARRDWRACVFGLSLAEAFANSVERVVSSDAQRPDLALFCALSSHFCFDRRWLVVTAHCEERFGVDTTFELTMVAFLALNLGFDARDRDQVVELLRAFAADACGSQTSDGVTLGALFSLCSELNPRFRIETVAVQFALLGLQDPKLPELRADLLAWLSTSAIRKAVTDLRALALERRCERVTASSPQGAAT